MEVKVKRALLSVWDKAGLIDLARGLHELGVEIVSSGNTSATLEQAGIPVTRVETVTGSPTGTRDSAYSGSVIVSWHTRQWKSSSSPCRLRKKIMPCPHRA